MLKLLEAAAPGETRARTKSSCAICNNGLGCGLDRPSCTAAACKHPAGWQTPDLVPKRELLPESRQPQGRDLEAHDP